MKTGDPIYDSYADDNVLNEDEEYPHTDSDGRKFKYDTYTLNPEMRKSIEKSRKKKLIPSDEFWSMID